MDILIAALIALGAKGIEALSPQIIELLSMLLANAINALSPEGNEAKQSMVQPLVDEVAHVVMRLEESAQPGSSKAERALVILKYWNADHGSLFTTNQIEIVLKLMVEKIKGGK